MMVVRVSAEKILLYKVAVTKAFNSISQSDFYLAVRLGAKKGIFCWTSISATAAAFFSSLSYF